MRYDLWAVNGITEGRSKYARWLLYLIVESIDLQMEPSMQWLGNWD